MKKRNRTGLIVLFIVILVAIVIAGQQFSTIGVADDGSTDLGTSCSATSDCVNQYSGTDAEPDRLSCVSGSCHYIFPDCLIEKSCSGGEEQ